MEVLAQLANEVRRLALDDEDVSMPAVASALGGDGLAQLLGDLYVATRRRQLPADPYSDDGLLFRIYKYRHHVTHRGANPSHFELGLGAQTWCTAHLHLDPRSRRAGPSEAEAADELRRMLALMSNRCEAVIAAL